MNQLLFDTIFRLLIHSIWISLVIYLITKVFLLIATRSRSAVRYWISVTGLFFYVISMLAVAIYSLKSNYSLQHEKINLLEALGSGQIEGDVFKDGSGSSSNGISYWITMAYFFGVSIFFLRSVFQYLKIKLEIRKSTVVPSAYLELMKKLRSGLGIKRNIRLVESTGFHSPALFGMMKPVIIVPVGILGNMPFNQVEALLMHELLHIRRYDFLINIIQNIVETLSFYNPFVWMLSAVIRNERELYCDDGVIASGSDPGTYVRALYAVSLPLQERNTYTLAAGTRNKQHLLIRIKRILKTEPMKNKMKPGVFLGMLIIAGMLGIISLSAFESPFFNIEKDGNRAKELIQEEAITIPDTIPIEKDIVVSDNEEKEIRKHVIIDSDSLTDEEKQELKEVLEEVHAQLDSINWDDIITDLEETRLELMEGMPEMLEEELLRVREQLESIDEAAIREQMELAREQVMKSMEDFNIEDLQLDIEASMKDLQVMMVNGDIFSEEEMEKMNKELKELKEIDFEDIRKDMENALKDLEIDIDFDYDIDFDVDSIMKELEVTFESIDIEEIKSNISESMEEIQSQLEEISEKEN